MSQTTISREEILIRAENKRKRVVIAIAFAIVVTIMGVLCMVVATFAVFRTNYEDQTDQYKSLKPTMAEQYSQYAKDNWYVSQNIRMDKLNKLMKDFEVKTEKTNCQKVNKDYQKGCENIKSYIQQLIDYTDLRLKDIAETGNIRPEHQEATQYIDLTDKLFSTLKTK